MTAVLARLVPRSIAGQIVILVVSSLILAHGILTLTFFYLSPRPGPPGPRGTAMANLAFAARLLDRGASADARTDLVHAVRDTFPEIGVLAVPRIPDRDGDDHPARGLRSMLGERFDVFMSRSDDPNDHVVRIGVRLQSGITLSAPLPAPAGPGGPNPVLMGTLVFLASAIALLSVWAAMTLVAPLTRFADAADRFTLGGSDAPLPERGPREIVRAARALNDMRGRVRRLVEDRARMLAAISHDLRTPITRLRLRAEDIDQVPLRMQVVRDLETMQNMVQSALSFLREQVTTARRETLDLPTLVQTVCDDFADLGHAVGFVGPAHLYLAGDADQLARAVINLVDNGLKFGTAVNVRVTAEPGGEVCIDVEDNGPGISDEEKTRVLEPFYRGDPARSLDGQDGVGLGLSIARSIVEAHDGMLGLHDAQPRGLLVRVRLPRGPAEEPTRR
jgi:signal transduction histidine kinase